MGRPGRAVDRQRCRVVEFSEVLDRSEDLDTTAADPRTLKRQSQEKERDVAWVHEGCVVGMRWVMRQGGRVGRKEERWGTEGGLQMTMMMEDEREGLPTGRGWVMGVSLGLLGRLVIGLEVAVRAGWCWPLQVPELWLMGWERGEGHLTLRAEKEGMVCGCAACSKTR